MKDNVFFLVCQVLERNVGAYAHRSAYILHERPHECVPWRYCTFVYGEILVRDECGFVYCTDSSCTVASPACSLAVERQIFSSRRIEMFSAYGTDEVFSGSYPQ